jgi:hypothetical protein
MALLVGSLDSPGVPVLWAVLCYKKKQLASEAVFLGQSASKAEP